MSRTLAQKDRFRATALNKMKAGPRSIVRELDEAFLRSPLLKDVFWTGSGWRSNSKEHGNGDTIDQMFVENVGRMPTPKEREAMLVYIDWLVANHKELGIEGILVSRDGAPRTEVWGYSTPGKGWRSLTNRGSISANHVDHVHINFFENASWPSSLNGVIIGGGKAPAPKPGLPSTGVSKSVSQMADEVIAGKHGTGHSNRQRSLGISAAEYAKVRAEVNRRTGTKATTQPKIDPIPAFPRGLRPNSSKVSAVALQRQLKKAGFLEKNVKESSNYGPRTQYAVAKFHEKHPEFKTKGVRRDIVIGPKGWAFLFERY